MTPDNFTARLNNLDVYYSPAEIGTMIIDLFDLADARVDAKAAEVLPEIVGMES